MDVNNNYNNYKTSFSGVEKKETKMFDKNRAMNVLMTSCKEGLYNEAERNVPENGIFGKVSVAFIIPKSNNEGLFYVTHSAENPKDQRVLSVGVHHKNSDRMTSNILLTGTKEEILEYLKSEENTQALIDTVNHLSDKTDEYYSSL